METISLLHKKLKQQKKISKVRTILQMVIIYYFKHRSFYIKIVFYDVLYNIKPISRSARK